MLCSSPGIPVQLRAPPASSFGKSALSTKYAASSSAASCVLAWHKWEAGLSACSGALSERVHSLYRACARAWHVCEGSVRVHSLDGLPYLAEDWDGAADELGPQSAVDVGHTVAAREERQGLNDSRGRALAFGAANGSGRRAVAVVAAPLHASQCAHAQEHCQGWRRANSLPHSRL